MDARAPEPRRDDVSAEELAARLSAAGVPADVVALGPRAAAIAGLLHRLGRLVDGLRPEDPPAPGTPERR